MVYVVNSNINNSSNLESAFSEISRYAHELINEFEYSVLEYKYNFLLENGYVLEKAEEQAKKTLVAKFKEMIHKLVVAIANMRDAVIRKVKSIISKGEEKQKAKAEAIKKKAEDAYNRFKKETDVVIMDVTDDDIISPEKSRRLRSKIVTSYNTADADFKRYASDLNF